MTVHELQAIERGEHEPTRIVFERMTTVYQRSESVLLLTTTPPEPPSVANFRGLTRGSAPKGDTALAIREARRVQAFLSELVSDVRELLPRFSPPPLALVEEPD